MKLSHRQIVSVVLMSVGLLQHSLTPRCLAQDESRRISSTADIADISWGEPNKGLRAGFRLVDRTSHYTFDDVVTLEYWIQNVWPVLTS